MTTIPANPSGLPPVEALLYAGWLRHNYANSAATDLLAIGATYTGSWEDVSGYCEFRLLTLSDVASAANGVHIDWSMNGIAQHATEVAGTAAAGVLYDSGIIAFHMPYVRIRYVNGAAAQASFLLRMLCSPTSIGGGGGGGGTSTIVDATPSAPTHGVTTAIATDNSTLVATVQVGKRYILTVLGTEGVVWTNSAGPAARATDAPVWNMMAREFIAVHASVYCQKLVAATSNGSVNVCPLDGGTIA